MKYFFYVCALVVMAIFACNSTGVSTSGHDTAKKLDDTAPKKQPVSAPTNPKEIDPQLNNFAKFIAGTNTETTYKTSETQAWKNYAKSNENQWNEIDNRLAKPISKWVADVKYEIADEPKTLFYPFAGGDFYYANLFFPNQDTIIMIGLEPCGSIFNPDSVSANSMANYYNNLQHTMFFPHKYGFFRTLSMKVDFNRGPLNGTMHTALFYMAKFGYNIHYIEHYNIDQSGKIVDVTQGKDVKKANKFHAYRIGYSKPGEKTVREMNYFSIDASNTGLSTKFKGYLTFIQSHKKVVTFFKAASYLMHNHLEKEFSAVRNYVGLASVRVLQDDSGLPLSFMNKQNWDVTCLGNYTRTIALFANCYQRDLRDAYVAQKPEKLPFKVGYNVEFGECNLQLAKPKK